MSQSNPASSSAAAESVRDSEAKAEAKTEAKTPGAALSLHTGAVAAAAAAGAAAAGASTGTPARAETVTVPTVSETSTPASTSASAATANKSSPEKPIGAVDPFKLHFVHEGGVESHYIDAVAAGVYAPHVMAYLRTHSLTLSVNASHAFNPRVFRKPERTITLTVPFGGSKSEPAFMQSKHVNLSYDCFSITENASKARYAAVAWFTALNTPAGLPGRRISCVLDFYCLEDQPSITNDLLWRRQRVSAVASGELLVFFEATTPSPDRETALDAMRSLSQRFNMITDGSCWDPSNTVSEPRVYGGGVKPMSFSKLFPAGTTRGCMNTCVVIGVRSQWNPDDLPPVLIEPIFSDHQDRKIDWRKTMLVFVFYRCMYKRLMAKIHLLRSDGGAALEILECLQSLSAASRLLEQQHITDDIQPLELDKKLQDSTRPELLVHLERVFNVFAPGLIYRFQRPQRNGMAVIGITSTAAAAASQPESLIGMKRKSDEHGAPDDDTRPPSGSGVAARIGASRTETHEGSVRKRIRRNAVLPAAPTAAAAAAAAAATAHAIPAALAAAAAAAAAWPIPPQSPPLFSATSGAAGPILSPALRSPSKALRFQSPMPQSPQRPK